MQRELYLDFAHQGYTAIDQISGQFKAITGESLPPEALRDILF